MKTVTLKKCLFAAAAGLLLSPGMSLDVFAQSRGDAAGRGASAGGGVRPSGPIESRRVVVIPGDRRGSVIDNFPAPTRRIPDIERTRRDEDERTRRAERERRDERRRQEDKTRREETRRREATRRHEEEANRFQKLGRWLDVSPERLQNFYLEAKAANPNLRLGQFFAAFVIANRLNGSHPSVTPQAILRGLDGGMSLERTLGALGLSGEEIKAAVKWAERVVNHLKP